MSKKKKTEIFITNKNPFHNSCRFKTGYGFSGLENSRGFSVVSSMVAAGLMGLAMLSLTSTLVVPKKETKYIDQQFVSASLKYSVLQALQNKWLCSCQFDFVDLSSYRADSGEVELKGLRESCMSNHKIVEKGDKIGSGMKVKEIKLSDLLQVGSSDTYSGNLVISFDLGGLDLTNPNPEASPVRAINPISIPVLLPVDTDSTSPNFGKFLNCTTIASNPLYLPPGTPIPPTPPPGSPLPPHPVLPPFKLTIDNPPLSQGCEGVDGSVSTGSAHPNGGGFVASTAKVNPEAYVGLRARVCGFAVVRKTTSPAPRIEGQALISGDAEIYDHAVVSNNARVSGGKVYGHAKVKESSHVSGSAKVYGQAQICGESQIYGGKVYGNAKTCGKVHVYGDAEVSGNALVSCFAKVYGQAKVYGKADVSGSSKVYGKAQVYGDDVRLEGHAQVYGEAHVTKQANCNHKVYIDDDAKVFGSANVGCGYVAGNAEISGDAKIIEGGISNSGPSAMIWGKTKMIKGTIKADQGMQLMVGSPSDVDKGYVTKIEGGTISGNTQITENAKIKGGTLSDGNISGNAVIEGGTITGGKVYGSATISELAEISGNAEIYGSAKVYGQAKVYDYAWIYGSAKVYGQAKVYGFFSQVYGNAMIEGGEIYGFHPEVYGGAKVEGGEIYDDAEVFGNAEIQGGKIFNGAKVSSGIISAGTEINGAVTPPP